MAVKKVEFGGQTLIDLTGDTATANDVLSGKTFHANDGTVQSGSIATQAAQTITPTTTNQTIASGVYLAGTQTVLGDANLVASNIADGVTIFGVSGTHQGGGDDLAEHMASRVFPSGTYSYTVNVSTVGAYAFCGMIFRNQAIVSMAFPNCVSVESHAFEQWIYSGAGALTPSIVIDLPECTSIGAYAFNQTLCGSISYIGVNAPNCVTIASNAFQDIYTFRTNLYPCISFSKCTFVGDEAFLITSNTYNGSSAKVTSLSFPVCTTIGNSAFRRQVSVSFAYFPQCTTVGTYAFNGCSRLSDINLKNVTSIGSSAFQGCTALSSISFSVCVTVGADAFESCTTLSSISLPQCTTIGTGAFRDCPLSVLELPRCTVVPTGSNWTDAIVYTSNISLVSMPVCTSIGAYGFYSLSATSVSFYFPMCTNIASNAFRQGKFSSITSTMFPKVTTLGSDAFSNCTNLTNVCFPSCTQIGSYAFGSCYSLVTASFPACTSVMLSAFYRCSALESALFPIAKGTIGSYAFANCYTLSLAYFASVGSFASGVFNSCYNLLSLYILTSAVPTLGAASTFVSTPISNYTTSTGGVYGSIYVKASLLASFKAATRWSVYSARMVGLTDAEIASLSFI